MKYGWLLSIAALGVFALVSCGQQNAAKPEPTNIDIVMRAEPEPLAVGDTSLIVILKDANGATINGATLKIRGIMDHMGMEAIEREINQTTNGEYRIPFEWTMGGGWVVTVTAQLPENGGEVSKNFDFFVEAVSSESIINRPNATNSSGEVTAESRAIQTKDIVTIVYVPDSDPILDSDSVVTIVLTDAGGNPITDAAIQLVASMAHDGMMPVSGTGEHTENGRYVVRLNWTMAGDWKIAVKAILTDGQQIEQVFDQQVKTS